MEKLAPLWDFPTSEESHAAMGRPGMIPGVPKPGSRAGLWDAAPIPAGSSRDAQPFPSCTGAGCSPGPPQPPHPPRPCSCSSSSTSPSLVQRVGSEGLQIKSGAAQPTWVEGELMLSCGSGSPKGCGAPRTAAPGALRAPSPLLRAFVQCMRADGGRGAAVPPPREGQPSGDGGNCGRCGSVGPSAVWGRGGETEAQRRVGGCRAACPMLGAAGMGVGGGVGVEVGGAPGSPPLPLPSHGILMWVEAEL